MVIKLTSRLTLCIAVHVKLVLLITLSTVLFHVEITPLNGAGIVVLLLASARYSHISVVEKASRQNRGIVKAKEDEETGIQSITESKEGR